MSAPAALAQHPTDCNRCDFELGGVKRSMLSPADVATLWGIPKSVVYRLIRTGRLPVLNLSPGSRGGKGQRYLIRSCALRELQASHDEPVPPQ